MDWLTSVLCIVIALVATVYFLIRWRYNYWARRRVPYVVPKFPLGNLQGVGKKYHSSTIMKKIYNEYKHKTTSPFVGIFFIVRPFALILDLDLVKSILVKDFQYFQNRGVYFNEKDDPLSAHLFSLEGEKWRFLRSKLTPSFSSGKMKMMFHIITELGDKLVDQIKTDGTDVEVKGMFARYTTDIIGNCAFGIDCNSLKDQNADFLKMGQRVFDPPKSNVIYRLMVTTFRDLSRTLGLKSVNEEVANFFYGAVNSTVKYRKENKTDRDDFMNSLLQMEARSDLTMDEVAAQVFLFQLAGFETSSTTLTYINYELALNPDIQERAREEVNRILALHNGQLTYEAIQEMTYLEQVINESLRKYPPGSNLLRCLTKDYKIENTDVVLEKGNFILVPILAIHHDSDIYPDPLRFDPDRFTSAEIGKRHHMSFLPFGEGPRICIGIRFAIMEIKVGLAKLLLNFKIEKTESLSVPMEMSTKHLILSPKGDVLLRFKSL